MGQRITRMSNSSTNVLLVCVPLAIIPNYLGINSVIAFTLNFIAIIPLATLLSYATEQITLRAEEKLGILLRLTFGYDQSIFDDVLFSTAQLTPASRNTIGLVVSILALAKREFIIVQYLLIGSILSKLILGLGICFLLGGSLPVEESFTFRFAQSASRLLLISLGTFSIPTAFHEWSSGMCTSSKPFLSVKGR